MVLRFFNHDKGIFFLRNCCSSMLTYTVSFKSNEIVMMKSWENLVKLQIRLLKKKKKKKRVRLLLTFWIVW